MIDNQTIYLVVKTDSNGKYEIDGWELKQLMGMGKVASYIES